MKKQFQSMILTLCLVLTALLPMQGAKAANVTVENAYSLYDLGLFQGTSNGFQLEQRPTRLEGMTMFVRLLGGEKEAGNEKAPHPFSDVPGWGDPYVGYAWEHKLTKGVSGDTFGSTDYITLEQYVTFVLRALRYDDSKGDFAWNTAVDKAVEIGLLTRGEAREYLSQTTTRGTMVNVSFAALKQTFKGSAQTLAERLVEEGVFTREAAIGAGVWTGEVPELPEQPEPGETQKPIPDPEPAETEKAETRVTVVEEEKPEETKAPAPAAVPDPKPMEESSEPTVTPEWKPAETEKSVPVQRPGSTYREDRDTEVIEEAGEEQKSLLQECPPYQSSEMSFYVLEIRGSFSVMGISHREGMVGKSKYSAAHALFNLRGEHTLLSFTSAPTDSKTSGGRAVIYFDGRFVDEFDVDGGTCPVSHSYDVTGVEQVRVEFLRDSTNYPQGVALYDMNVK